MDTYKKIILATFAVLMIGIVMPLAAAQGNSIEYQYSAGIVTLTTDDISIKVTGNNQAPHFHWWDPNTPTVDYHVMFVRMFEANDTNADGIYTNGTDTMIGAPLALPTIGWEFSDFVVDEEGENITAVHFNFTTTTEFNPRPEGTGMDYGNLPNLTAFNVTIEVRVHLNLSTPGEMKFDLIVGGWEWTYEDSILVLQFNLTESNHGEVQGDRDPSGFHKTGTMFQFENGYFQYEETALAANNSLQVRASYGEGVGLEAGQAIYLAFENFGNEILEYDPILGIETSTSTGIVFDPMTIALIGGAVVVLLLVAVIVRKR
ncbi:MAG: hypothetical protein OEV85_00525 [Candidatus Thorarchaeota archaeon]|nr:hypothetical protein [Candidatus Thorarchaeota archaeon]